MSDTVVVHEGRRHPADRHAAGYLQRAGTTPLWPILSGRRNIMDGVMLRGLPVWSLPARSSPVWTRALTPMELVDVVIRPEDIEIVPADPGPAYRAWWQTVIFKGVHYEMHVRQAGYEWIIHSTQAAQVGELIGMNIGPDEIHIMKKEGWSGCEKQKRPPRPIDRVDGGLRGGAPGALWSTLPFTDKAGQLHAGQTSWPGARTPRVFARGIVHGRASPPCICLSSPIRIGLYAHAAWPPRTRK